jgi:hypothetical protein
MDNFIFKVKDVLFELIPPLFLKISHTVDASQAEKKVDAKLKAALKHKKTLDMARILKTDLADQQTVAPENMETLVNSLVDRQISSKEKQGKKALLQAVRKKIFGRGQSHKDPSRKAKQWRQAKRRVEEQQTSWLQHPAAPCQVSKTAKLARPRQGLQTPLPTAPRAQQT